MKLRLGFVSNSSSSGFLIEKKYLSADQIELIRNHFDEARKREKEGTYYQHISCGDVWSIYETDDNISGATWMDNFDMHDYLTKVVGIASEHIKMDGDEPWLDDDENT